MKDELGDRVKGQYEDRTRYMLPRRTYTIIRLDGKAFHSFTKGFDRPFDTDLVHLMNQTTKYLCESIQGCKIGYVQSDEISLILTDFEQPKTNAWFDGNVQKITSISASMATLKFNRLLNDIDNADQYSKGNPKFYSKNGTLKSAIFDSRVFTIADYFEVENYLIWRQQDAVKNSISQVAQSLYSHKQLENRNGIQKKEMIIKAGQNWDEYPVGQRQGRCVVKGVRMVKLPEGKKTVGGVDFIPRSEWKIIDPPIFSKEKFFLRNEIPNLHNRDLNVTVQK